MNKFFKIFVSIPIIFVGIFVAVSSIQTLKMSDQFRLKNAIDKRFINLEEIFEYNLMRNLRSISSIFSLHSSSLPMIEIKIPSANLKKLNSDMPYSGLEYTSAWLNYGGNFKKINTDIGVIAPCIMFTIKNLLESRLKKITHLWE